MALSHTHVLLLQFADSCSFSYSTPIKPQPSCGNWSFVKVFNFLNEGQPFSNAIQMF